MIVGVSVAVLHLPGARSLKEKRKVIKSLVDRIHSRYRVSVAETGFQNTHQRSEIGIAIVGTTDFEVERLMNDIQRIFDGEPGAMLTHWSPEFLRESS